MKIEDLSDSNKIIMSGQWHSQGGLGGSNTPFFQKDRLDI